MDGVATAQDREQAAADAAAVLARPWPRYWARLLDLQIEMALLGFVVVVAAPGFLDAAIFKGAGGDYVLSFVLAGPVMVLDGLILGLFGQTIGKAIAGVAVRTAEGGKLPLGRALLRGVAFYVTGLGLAFPPAMLVINILSYRAVKSGRLTYWDRALSTRVVDRKSSAVRTTVTALLVLLFVIADRLLGTLS